MPYASSGQNHRTYIAYCVKAALLILLLFVCAREAPAWPVLCLTVLWAVLSFVSMLAPLYFHVVFRKTPRHQQFRSRSFLSWFNDGRVISTVVLFTVSAACSLALVFTMAGWDAREWAVAIVAALFFPLAYALVNKLFARQLTPFFLNGWVVRACCVIVAVVLVVIDALMLWQGQPTVFQGPVQAVVSVNQPFENSPSPLLADLAWLSALVKGIAAYGLSEVAEASYTGYCIAELVLDAAAYYSFSCLLGVCWLRHDDVTVAFSSLRSNANSTAKPRLKWLAVIWAAAMPILLVALSVQAENHAIAIEQSGQASAVKQVIREVGGLSVDVIDGTYYDHLMLEKKLGTFSLDASGDLDPLVVNAFQTRIDNVDGFLDWYFNIWNLSGELFDQDRTKQQFSETINSGADDAELASKMQEYVNRASDMQSSLSQDLAECAITYDLPDWLTKQATPLDESDLERVERPAVNIIKAGALLGIEPGGNASSDAVAASITNYLESTETGKTLFGDTVKTWLNRSDCQQGLKDDLAKRRDAVLALLNSDSSAKG